jgi:hypothetical protein
MSPNPTAAAPLQCLRTGLHWTAWVVVTVHATTRRRPYCTANETRE